MWLTHIGTRISTSFYLKSIVSQVRQVLIYISVGLTLAQISICTGDSLHFKTGCRGVHRILKGLCPSCLKEGSSTHQIDKIAQIYARKGTLPAKRGSGTHGVSPSPVHTMG